ncbi:hypothetical protein BDR06DRAFT_965475 [Suillus hirtellus]|nr:hypothetical protein BDR06DRAFT_965475 [Suillus hirtellus]
MSEGTWEKLAQVAVKGAQYDSRERQPHPKCLEGTRVVLLNYIYESLDRHGNSQFIWLHGTAGVGKSAVAFTVAERMRGLKVKEGSKEKRLAGTFFFSRKHTKRRTTGYFFATLIYQLASNFPSIREDVNRIILDNPALLDHDTSLRDQMEALFLRPLQRLKLRLRECPPLTFVIDALDECASESPEDDTSESELTDLISLLGEALREPDLPITHILLTSRSEEYIHKAMQTEEIRPLVCEIPVRTSGEGVAATISLDGVDVDNDIYVFLQHSFRELGTRHPDFPQPSTDELARLASRAGRRFIVASTMMKFIDDRHNDPRDRLQLMLELTSELLPGTEVYKLYDRILSTCADPRLAYLHLSVIAALADPLPMAQISKLLGPGEGRDVESVLVQLRSVIDVPTDSSLPVNIYHSSVRDYVSHHLNSSLCQVHDITSPHSLLALSCLRLMVHDLPESTALLDTLSELTKHGQAMESHEPQDLKHTLDFIVQPPEPLQVLIGLLWIRAHRNSELQFWLDTRDGHTWLQTERGKDWLQTEGGECWLQTERGERWLQSEEGEEWLQTKGGKNWLQSEGGERWLQTEKGERWLQTEEGEEWLQTKGGKNWLQSEGGERWLQTEKGERWLQTEEGEEWLQTKGGKNWLQSEGGERWLQTEKGEEWLQTKGGERWLQTRGGKHWLQTWGGKDWLQTRGGKHRQLQTPNTGHQLWILGSPEHNSYLHSLNTSGPLQTLDDTSDPPSPTSSTEAGWLQTTGGGVPLQTSGTQAWLQALGGRHLLPWLETQVGRYWLLSQGGRDWLQTQDGQNWLQAHSERQHWFQAEVGRETLQTQRGREWLQTQGGKNWLQTFSAQGWLQTQGGKDWLQTLGVREWLQTQGGKDWLQTLDVREWLQTQGGKDWIQTLEGRDWPQTQGGQEWLRTTDGGEWLQTPGGKDWLQTQVGRDWLQTLGGRDWLQTPQGQTWRLTTLWVTMEEYSSTLEAIGDFVIVPDSLLQPTFQVIQQFRNLPDFLSFPAFLALRHQNHSTFTSTYNRPLPDMETIHAMVAFIDFASQAWERSRLTSDALKYACQNWALHLSRAPNPWDERLTCILESFRTHNLVSWLERQWCLKDLRSCLTILREGEKLAQEHLQAARLPLSRV